MTKCGLEQSLFEFIDVDCSDAARFPTAVDDILARRLDGLIVRGVFSPATAATVAGRLDEKARSMRQRKLPTFEHLEVAPHMLGVTLSSLSNLDEYFVESAAFRHQCRDLFRGGPDFEVSLERVLSAVANGRPAKVPDAPGGGTYASASICVLPCGHELEAPARNQLIGLPQARHLVSVIDTAAQLSYFIPLTTPEQGGELVVYAIEQDNLSPPAPSSDPMLAAYGPMDEVFWLFERFGSTTFSPGVGDMLIFDGGRYHHGIAPVLGDTPRRTIGGSLALSKDHHTLYYWS